MVRLSVEREREMGKEGLRAMGVVRRESFTRMSQMVEKGRRRLGSKCMQSQTKSCTRQSNNRSKVEHCLINRVFFEGEEACTSQGKDIALKANSIVCI